MSYKGKYQPRNPQKYVGDSTNIIYRSLWERKFMIYCDTNDNVLEYASEEIAIPYRSPIDGKVHRYFPDFYIKVKESNGIIEKYLIEIKPYKQTMPPPKPKRQTKDISMKHMSMPRTNQNGKRQENTVKTEDGPLKF